MFQDNIVISNSAVIRTIHNYIIPEKTSLDIKVTLKHTNWKADRKYFLRVLNTACRIKFHFHVESNDSRLNRPNLRGTRINFIIRRCDK